MQNVLLQTPSKILAESKHTTLKSKQDYGKVNRLRKSFLIVVICIKLGENIFDEWLM